MRTRACERLGIELPIFAFSHCRDVVAAVSKAGGMGVLGALAFTPEQLEVELNWIDEHVEGRPYGVDVVMPAKLAAGSDAGGADLAGQLRDMIPQEHRDWLESVLEEHGVPKMPEDADGAGDDVLGWVHEKGRQQVDIALSHPIALLANALGPPPADIVELSHEHDVVVAALSGSVQHAERQVAQGVDIIIAQGSEAGGHTGEIGSVVLWPDVVDAVGDRALVLGAGGIGSGRQMAAALVLGCDGVWTGSLWLATAESDLEPPVMEKLLAATAGDTIRSRSWTGKPARMLRTEWTDLWERDDCPGPLPMPLQYMLIADAQRRIYAFHKGELMGTAAGQVVGRMDSVRPARDVVFDLVDEFIDAIDTVSPLVARS